MINSQESIDDIIKEGFFKTKESSVISFYFDKFIEPNELCLESVAYYNNGGYIKLNTAEELNIKKWELYITRMAENEIISIYLKTSKTITENEVKNHIISPLMSSLKIEGFKIIKLQIKDNLDLNIKLSYERINNKK